MKYHVQLGDRRTTVSIDDTLSNLLSLKLGFAPGTQNALKAVQKWLQARIDEQNDPNRIRTSQWLQAQVVESLISAELAKKHDQWILDGIK